MIIEAVPEDDNAGQRRETLSNAAADAASRLLPGWRLHRERSTGAAQLGQHA